MQAPANWDEVAVQNEIEQQMAFSLQIKSRIRATLKPSIQSIDAQLNKHLNLSLSAM